MSDIVRTTRRGKVLEIVFDRPPVNAINRAASRALYAAFAELRDDPDLVIGIVTGVGDKVFSAGWDLKEASAADYDTVDDMDPDQGSGPGGFAGNTELWDCHKPLIAAVNGVAVGGGFELALGCDLMVAAEHARFGLPEMQRGLLADAGAIQRLPRRMPYNVCMELLLTGRWMSADEAMRWGIVNRVVPGETLMDEARALADEISEGAPLAMQALKAIMQEIEMMPLRQAMEKTKKGKSGVEAYERMAQSEDYIEGPLAFTEKRKPNWKGR